MHTVKLINFSERSHILSQFHFKGMPLTASTYFVPRSQKCVQENWRVNL